MSAANSMVPGALQFALACLIVSLLISLLGLAVSASKVRSVGIGTKAAAWLLFVGAGSGGLWLLFVLLTERAK